MAHLINSLEKRPSEHSGRLKVAQRVAEGGHMAENQPPSVVDLVRGRVFMRHLLVAHAGWLEIPVIETMQKRLGHLGHDLELALAQVMVS